MCSGWLDGRAWSYFDGWHAGAASWVWPFAGWVSGQPFTSSSDVVALGQSPPKPREPVTATVDDEEEEEEEDHDRKTPSSYSYKGDDRNDADVGPGWSSSSFVFWRHDECPSGGGAQSTLAESSWGRPSTSDAGDAGSWSGMAGKPAKLRPFSDGVEKGMDCHCRWQSNIPDESDKHNYADGGVGWTSRIADARCVGGDHWWDGMWRRWGQSTAG